MTPRATPVRRAIRPLLALAAILTAVVAAGCVASDPDGTGADIVSSPSPAASEAPADNAGDLLGTRGNPVPAGTVVRIGDWQVKLGATNTNANEIVAAENQFNEPPAEGRQFVMVPVDLVYKGTESGFPNVNLLIQFLGAGGNTFGAADTAAYCGVIPNDLSNAGEMFPGAAASGNVCLGVPSDQVGGGAWMVQEALTLDDGGRTFFALA